MTMTTFTFLARVGNLDLYRDGRAYALFTRDGEKIGTYASARAANDAGIALITASLKART